MTSELIKVGFDYDEPIFPWYDSAHIVSVRAGLADPDGEPPTQWEVTTTYGCSRQEWVDVEVDRIAREVGKEGEVDTRTLAARLGASRWGPGRYRAALREAVDEGAIVRIGRNRVAPAGRDDTTDD